MGLGFEELTALQRVAKALEHQNALTRMELHTELEARVDYPSDLASVQDSITQLEREYLREGDFEQEVATSASEANRMHADEEGA